MEKKNKSVIDENATSFTDDELDINHYSKADQKEMLDFIDEFMNNPENFEDDVPYEDEQ